MDNNYLSREGHQNHFCATVSPWTNPSYTLDDLLFFAYGQDNVAVDKITNMGY